MSDIDVQRLLVRLEARIDKYEQNLARANAQTDKRARAIEARFDQSVRHLDDAGRRMGKVYDPLLAASRRVEGQLGASSAKIRGALLTAASPLATGFAAGFTADRVKDYADGYTRYTNQLKLAGLEGQRLAGTQDQLYAIAQKYGAPLEQLGTLYGKIATAQNELGASSEDLMRFSRGTAAALKVQGGEASAARGALLQLTQGLGSDVFRAEEFNSVLEGARPILMAVVRGSDRWGGSLAKLRADVIAGTVSSKELFRAAIKGFTDTESVAERSTLTIGASLQIVNNALGKYIGETDSSLSATARLSAGIQSVANNLDLIIPALAVIGAAYATRVAAGIATANAAQIELALAVVRGNAVMLDGVTAAAMKARAETVSSRAQVAAIEASIAKLREEAGQYQANIALINEQRLAARAAEAQAKANTAAGFGNVRVGAGAQSGPINAGLAAATFGEAGKSAIAERRKLVAVNKELEAAEAALVLASARATAAEATRKVAMNAASVAARAGAIATKLFTGALTLIGGSVAGGAVVLAIGAIVGAILLHNREVKQAAADQNALRATTVALNDKLKDTARFGHAAGEGVKGLGSQAATATPKVTAFAGAVGDLADQLYRAASARRAEQIASLEALKSKSQVDLNKAAARREQELRATRGPIGDPGDRAAAAGGAAVGLTVAGAMANSQAAQEVAQAEQNLRSADAEIKRLKALKTDAFVTEEDRNNGRNLPAELASAQQQLKVAQAAHNGEATRDLQAQIYTIQKTLEYRKQGLSYEVASAAAAKEAAAIKSAGDDYAARQSAKAGGRVALREERQDLQHDRRFAAELTRAQDEQLQAQSDLTRSVEDRLAVELSRIETARVAKAQDLADQAKSAANPSGLSAAEIDQLTKLSDETAARQKDHARAVADQEIADQAVALAENDRNARVEILQAQEGLATTLAERRDREFRILELQQEEERARLEAVVASKTATDAEKEIARRRLAVLPALEAMQRRVVDRANETQLDAYRRSLRAPQAELIDKGAVEGLQTLRSALLDAAKTSGDFATVLSEVGRSIGEEVLGDLIDQLLVAPASDAIDSLIETMFGAASATSDVTAAGAASAKAAADTAATVSVAGLTAAATAASAALAALTAAAASSASAEAGGTALAFLGLRGGGAIPGYAGGGGLVRGPGGPTDDAILAQMASGRFLKLSNEEFVVNAQGTRKHRALLEAINSGSLKGYAAGGSLSAGGSITSVSKVNSLRLGAGSVGGRGSVYQFDLRGAVLTEQLMHDINGRILASESRAVVRGAQGGAAMVQAQMQKSATMRLGR